MKVTMVIISTTKWYHYTAIFRTHIRCKSSDVAMVTFNGDTAFFKSYNNILHYIFGLVVFLHLQYNYINQFMQSTHHCLFVWWCLTPLSTKVQLYRGGQFNCWRTRRKPVVSHWQTLSYNVVHFALIEIRTCNISGKRHWIKRFRKFRI